MSLNAIYAAVGSPANREPKRWFRNEDVATFLLTIIAEQLCRILLMVKKSGLYPLNAGSIPASGSNFKRRV